MIQPNESRDMARADRGESKLVLVGNPNVGKSVFFNVLTGIYADVSNFPGTTVDISFGHYKNYIVMDTPGIYSVSSFSEEETVARDIILSADIILNVVDAVHLGRDLFLTKQLIDMGKPMLIALNQMDDVKRNGIKIDIKKLEALLGVKVIPTTAIRREGLEEVLEEIKNAKPGNRDPELLKQMELYKSKVKYDAEALLILEEDEVISNRYNVKQQGLREQIYLSRRHEVDKIISEVTEETNIGVSFQTKLGRWMLSPATGIPLLAVTLYILYKIIGVLVAGTIVDFTEKTIMENMYKPFIISAISGFVTQQSFLGKVLIGEFGILTMAPIYIFGLLLPLIIGFYLLMGLLEDSGYLPRIAVLTDRSLSSIGLNGKAIIPIILGFGCVTMATMTTRILGTKREKIIATMLLGLVIPCSAQLGIIAGLISQMPVRNIIIYFVTIITIFIAAGTVLNKLLPGESSDLLIDLPPIRFPQLKNIILKTWQKSSLFMKEAIPLFALGALLISIIEYTGILTSLQNLLIPLTVNWLKLPKEAATAFIMGIIRRDFGAAGLTGVALSPVQTLISLVVMTLFVPCIAAIMVIFKERGYKDAFLIWLGSFAIAFITGGILVIII